MSSRFSPRIGCNPSSTFSSINASPNCVWRLHSFPSFLMLSAFYRRKTLTSLTCVASSSNSGEISNPDPHHIPEQKPRKKPSGMQQNKVSPNADSNSRKIFPTTLPKKIRRGRRSEAAAVEDFVRDSLQQAFASVREQNADLLKGEDVILKKKQEDINDSDQNSDEEDGANGDVNVDKMVVEEDDPDWPLDADVGWGVRASEYFEKHPIKNVVAEDGAEIDWEGEVDDCWVKEINCLEWESFAFHPSPLIVLVFERYNRAKDNWKVLKELEKAAKVYWDAKDRLPPRTVKIDINIERDLAYALKVKECPEILFLRGNRIIYREKDIRTADELVQMIAHFYYNAKRPSCIKDAAFSPPF